MLRCKAESAKKKKKKIEVNQKYRQWAATEKGKKRAFLTSSQGQLRRKKKNCFTVWGKKTHAQAWVSACEQQQQKKNTEKGKRKMQWKEKKSKYWNKSIECQKEKKKKGIIPRSVRETNLMRLYRLCLWSSLFWFCSFFQEAVSYF